MEDVQNYEKFPLWIPILSNIFGLSVYAIGIYLITGFGTLWAILYLIYCLWVGIEVVRKSCVDCYYYGKVCGMGKGKLCALLFKKGNPKRFIESELTWFDMLPDLMVFVFPILGGFILLVRDFNWVTVAMMAILVILSTASNVFIRGHWSAGLVNRGRSAALHKRYLPKKNSKRKRYGLRMPNR